MDNNSTNLYGRYLTSLIGSSINNTAPEKPFEGINWESLYKLADFHNVSVLIFPVVSAMNLPEEVMKKFYYDNKLLIAREARQEIESQYIFGLLNQNDIKFIKLKGIVMKNLYPMPYMRTSSDIDIFMSSEDRLRARAIMAKAGYTLDEDIDYNDAYSKDNFYIYELHSSIVTSKSPYVSLFSDPFSTAHKDADGTNYVLNPTYFYIHMIVHLLNHFLSGGCSIRQLCDLYIYEKFHKDFNAEKVREIIKDYNLTDFMDNVRELTFALFEGKELNSEQNQIADFIFKSGEYGNGTLKRISWLADDKASDWTFGKKCKYFLSLWFPNVDTMKKRYPFVEKAPFLLPFYWVRRILYTIFFNRSAIKEQRNEIKTLNSKELKEAQRIRKLSGLK